LQQSKTLNVKRILMRSMKVSLGKGF